MVSQFFLNDAFNDDKTQKSKWRLKKNGVNDFYSQGGSYEYLKNIYGLSSEKIVETIVSNINK